MQRKMYTFYVFEKQHSLRLDLCHSTLLYFKTREGVMVSKIDFNKINDEIVYDIFKVDGNEAEALNDSYLELFELIGRDAMIKLFTHFRGDKIDCPMRLYRPEYIADLAKQETDRRERAKIARAGGQHGRKAYCR